MSKNGSGFGKFLIGASIGAGIALLFAPKKGSETRKELKEKIDDLVEKVKNIDISEVKDNINEKIDDIQKELKDLDKEKVIKIAKEKGNALVKKCDDLVKYAKKKGTPILQKAANDVRIKTIEVLEDTVTKLEAKGKTTK